MKYLPTCFILFFLSCSSFYLSGCDDPIATTIKEYKIDWPKTLKCTEWQRGLDDPNYPIARDSEGMQKKVRDLDRYSCFSQSDIARIEAEVIRLRRELEQCQNTKTTLIE